MAHVRSVGDGGEGKKRELGSHTFYDHDRILPGSKALTQHSPTFCHLSCGRSELSSEKRKRFCARLGGPRTILERWTSTSSRIVYPEVSFLRSGRGLSFNILPLRTVLPQQTHLLNEPISYLRTYGNPMPQSQKKIYFEEVSSSPHLHNLDPFC